METIKRHTKRVAVAVIGGVVLVVGIIAIPYPGPGWLIVFAGLAILATEFAWAQHLLDHARSKYDAWGIWLSRQHVAIRIAVLAGTCLVVLGTMLLLNVFGMIDHFLHLHQTWVYSPFRL